MALPTKSQVQAGEYTGDGSPTVQVAAKSAINLDALEYTGDGSPWWGTEDSATPPATTFIPKIIWI